VGRSWLVYPSRKGWDLLTVKIAKYENISSLKKKVTGMKYYQTSLVLGLTILLVFVVGCTSTAPSISPITPSPSAQPVTSAQPATPSSTPIGSHPDPIYHKGDVVSISDEDVGEGILIKNYDPAEDTYLVTWVQKSNDQTWYHGTDPDIFGSDEIQSRAQFETDYQYKIGSANVDNLPSDPS
jgi:hypothetical protein